MSFETMGEPIGPEHKLRVADMFVGEKASFASEYHASRNEDAAFIDLDTGSAGVFDGVGSKPGSEQAAQLAAAEVKAHLQACNEVLPIEQGEAAVGQALMQAHEAITSQLGTELATTAVVVKTFLTSEGLPYVAVANVGDSRAYLLRNTELSFLSIDYAYDTPELAEFSKRIQTTLSEIETEMELQDLEPIERVAFKRRHMIDAELGSDEIPHINTAHSMLEPGDCILLISDGVHDNLTLSRMQIISNMFDPASVDAMVDGLVYQAQLESRQYRLRAKPDDMTAVALWYEE